MKKTVIINGYYLSRPFTGFGVYTRGLLQALEKVTDFSKYQIIVVSPEKTDLKLKSIKIKIVPENKKLGASISKLHWEQIKFPVYAKRQKADLVHHFYPATVVFDKGIPQLTSIHDATPWHFGAHNPTLKIRLYRKFLVWSNRKADRFLSVSNYGRDDVAGVYGIDKKKIDVTYNGIDKSFRNTVTDAGKKKIREKYNLPQNYIFYIGGFEAHKNVKNLLLAFAQASKDIKEHLVIAGGVFSKSRLNVYKDFFEIPELIKEHKLENKVHLIGVVPDEDLPSLYQAGSLFVMPSLAEGFNLPLIQALASRVPAIASDIPITDEVAGNAVLKVDTTNIEILAAAISNLLSDKQKQKELIMKGLEIQDQYRWENAASRVLSIYDEMTK